MSTYITEQDERKEIRRNTFDGNVSFPAEDLVFFSAFHEFLQTRHEIGRPCHGSTVWRHIAMMDCAVPVSEVVPKNKQNTGADGAFTLPSGDKTHWMLDKGLLKHRQREEGCL